MIKFACIVDVIILLLLLFLLLLQVWKQKRVFVEDLRRRRKWCFEYNSNRLGCVVREIQRRRQQRRVGRRRPGQSKPSTSLKFRQLGDENSAMRKRKKKRRKRVAWFDGATSWRVSWTPVCSTFSFTRKISLESTFGFGTKFSRYRLMN